MKNLLIIIILLINSISFAADRAVVSKDSLKNIEPSEVYSESAAFIAGISDYSGFWPKLPGVKDDVKSVSRFLSMRGFDVEQVTDVGVAEYKRKLNSFLRRYGNDKNSRIIIYYAGHGHTLGSGDSKKGYAVFKDAKSPSKDEEGFIRGSVPMDYFSSLAENIKAKHVMFVFDSCFSGTVFSGMRSIPEFIISMLQNPARHFLTSGTEDQLVPDDSVFRRRFVEGIRGAADSNDDQIVTGSELGLFIQSTVSSYSEGTQTPVFGKLKQDSGEILFFNNSGFAVREKKGGKNPEVIADREKLIKIIQKNPHSPDAYKALEKLRLIDDSLKKLPPVEAPERKDNVIVVKSKVYHSGNKYPYVVTGPITIPWFHGKFEASFKLEAKDHKQYKKLYSRRMMILSVMKHRMKESNLQLVDNIKELRSRMRQAAKEGADFACPGCVAEEPLIAGMKYK